MDNHKTHPFNSYAVWVVGALFKAWHLQKLKTHIFPRITTFELWHSRSNPNVCRCFLGVVWLMEV